MRSSDWQITWDPAGVSPLVLLDYDDLMDAEIRLPREQLSAVGKADFSLRITPLARQNMKARLEFSRRLPHATAAASWDACLTGLTTLPWGQKAPLRVQPRGGVARDYTAAVLSSSHRPSYQDGIIESVHSYALRVVILPFPAGNLIVTGELTDGTNPVVFPLLLKGPLNGGKYQFNDAAEEYFAIWDIDESQWTLKNDADPLAQWFSTADVASPVLVPAGAWHAVSNPNGWKPSAPTTGTPVLTLA